MYFRNHLQTYGTYNILFQIQEKGERQNFESNDQRPYQNYNRNISTYVNSLLMKKDNPY